MIFERPSIIIFVIVKHNWKICCGFLIDVGLVFEILRHRAITSITALWDWHFTSALLRTKLSYNLPMTPGGDSPPELPLPPERPLKGFEAVAPRTGPIPRPIPVVPRPPVEP